ncbi:MULTISPECIES: hypothetical protein [unclassified Rhizobium]|uniref:hypothetical protein n=1 Tax=unclassified Rhizobium TaxID=2613769 RepID=UPI00161B9A02|nr:MULTISPECIES: hypothetical protein [unclassified Rhizobium]MBB3545238.1 hypothetical protein [Rhizobium sp. BK399]MCS3743216.1 hypothetical protein [Rhizobium sp. BK661]MCS4096356.1 hypothetical protein [Rhizobium sp. BK176]
MTTLSSLDVTTGTRLDQEGALLPASALLCENHAALNQRRLLKQVHANGLLVEFTGLGGRDFY